MIDYFSLALAHVLILTALWRMAGNNRLDEDPAFPKPHRKRHGQHDQHRKHGQGEGGSPRRGEGGA